MSRKLLILLFLLPLAYQASCQPIPADRPVDAAPAPARALRVVTSGGFAAAYDILAPQFALDSGIELKTAYGSSSGGAADSIPERLARDEPFDLVILSRSSLQKLTELGHVRPDTRRDLVRSSIGMAVRAGAPVPDISAPDAFVRVLLAAKSIGYSASASGTYLSTELWPRLGLWQRLEPKSMRILSERVAAVVARGEVEIGFQQISEILPIEGARFAGAIPPEYQKVTVFSAGITTRAQNIADAERLIDFLASKEVAATIAATGLEPVVTAP